ncbi:MAG: tetratricopeptide repeat protein, partial [Candidatus Riflebacteria bacterium]|nr:tetratricopeptide repeat protein [Candidatus Riflebacteria bacterium]
MQRVLRHIYLLTILVFLCKPVFCQPFDLVYPQGEETDNVTKELKKLQNIQRDLALEKLTREPSKLDAYIELAELRLSQGRLHEAKRFFEMALKLSPNNLQANHGLVMVHYHLGDFDKSRERLETIHRYHPLSDYEREKLEEYKAKLNTSGTAGMYIREDSRGFQEVMSSIEASFPSETYKKLEVKYRAEMWSHEDSTEQINSNVYSATVNYTADSNNILALTYSPETIRNGKSTNGFSLQGLAGNENMKLALRASKNIFKENIFTIKNQYEEDSQAITLYGNIHHRTKIVQGVTLTDISDNNSRRRYDTSVIYSL